MNAKPYDVIGIGIGPFNLGLAALTKPIEGFKGLFIDRNAEFSWHPGMILETATLQTPFLCDLVTMADPTSEYSFLNFLKKQGRIYSFYAFLVTTRNFFLLRNEFNQYCQWVASQMDSLLFNHEIESVTHNRESGLYTVHCLNKKTGARHSFETRHVVVGSGITPSIPAFCEPHKERLIHTSTYMDHHKALRGKKSITIIGSGQSAAEVYYDLLEDINKYGYTLNWFTRSPRFMPMELTKMTLQLTTPDYAAYFASLSQDKRKSLTDTMKDVYQGINATLLNDIFDLHYRKRLTYDIDTTLMANAELSDCHYDAVSKSFRLTLNQIEEEKSFEIESEAVIMATGYRFQPQDFLKPIAERLNWADDKRFVIAKNYSIDKTGHEVFIQNSELHAEGFVPPDLGRGCYRNSTIIRSVTGQEHYPIETSTAFQTFAAPSGHPLREAVRASA